jgi:hypothetical protein
MFDFGASHKDAQLRSRMRIEMLPQAAAHQMAFFHSRYWQ